MSDATKRIAIVDDKSELAEVYALVLRRANFDVEVFGGAGGELVDKLERGGFELVLMDMVMPENTGVNVVAEIRKRMGDKAPPCVMLTSMESEKDETYARDQGVVDYWRKDELQIEHLAGDVAEVIKRHPVG